MNHTIKIFVFTIYTSNICFGQSLLTLTEVGQGFSIPVEIAHDGISDDLYIVEKAGTIQRLNTSTQSKYLILDIDDRVNSSANERGLLGLAFHPDFATNGFIFVNYTRADGATVVSRFQRALGDLGLIDKTTEQVLLTIPQPFSNHNGGSLKFGPDGYLYIGMGDGGSGGDPGNRSQNPLQLLGKMLRIDVDHGDPIYSIPETNPYNGQTDTLPEIWAMGMRNPWKFSFDRLTGDLYIGDVGQNKWEEVDFQPASSPGGENYGWRCYEGYATYTTTGCKEKSYYQPPIHVFANDDAGDGCSITGGYVYRGTSNPDMYGRYIYGDYCSGNIWSLQRDECGNWYNNVVDNIGPQELATFGEDIHGELYIAYIGSGKVVKLGSACNMQFDVQITEPRSDEAQDGSILFTNDADVTITPDVNGLDMNALIAGTYSFTITNTIGCRTRICYTLNAKNITPINIGEQAIEVCSGEQFIVANLANADLDSVRIYRNNEYLKTKLADQIILSETGMYTFEGIKDACTIPIIGFFDFLILPSIVLTDITLSDTILIIGGDYVEYLLYKNGNLFATNATGIFNIPDIATGQYSIAVIDVHGCRSNIALILFNNTHDSQFNQISIAPNPTNGIVYVSNNGSNRLQNARVQLFDSKGSLISEYSLNQTSGTEVLTIDLQQKPGGMYYIKISYGKLQAVFRVVKGE